MFSLAFSSLADSTLTLLVAEPTCALLLVSFQQAERSDEQTEKIYIEINSTVDWAIIQKMHCGFLGRKLW